jgi:hypothetical protein
VILDSRTFDYLKPTPDQLVGMEEARKAAKVYARALDELLPDGPDKTYTLRKLREVAMWANIAVTRHVNGTPREAIEEYPADHPVVGDLGSVPL